MPFPVKICVICEEEFELKPDKPGFANRCPACSEPEEVGGSTGDSIKAGEHRSTIEMNEARRKAIRDMLYPQER